LALLGVGTIHLIDAEELDETNRNRYVGARNTDPIPGSLKVDLAERMIHEIDPTIAVEKVAESFVSRRGFDLITRAKLVVGCLDSEGARLILVELSSAYAIPYIDLASDIVPDNPPNYGGRLCFSRGGDGCLYCLNELDKVEAGHDLSGEGERRNRDAVYGLNRRLLGHSGPSVVSINGVVASLAITEIMVHVAGLRSAHRLQKYNGRTGKVTVSLDEPIPDCYYCKGIYGARDGAGVKRYLSS
jgi:hypothetical protein